MLTKVRVDRVEKASLGGWEKLSSQWNRVHFYFWLNLQRFRVSCTKQIQSKENSLFRSIKKRKKIYFFLRRNSLMWFQCIVDKWRHLFIKLNHFFPRSVFTNENVCLRCNMVGCQCVIHQPFYTFLSVKWKIIKFKYWRTHLCTFHAYYMPF